MRTSYKSSEKVKKNNALVSISDASRFLNVSIDTIRRWEKKGLVKGQRDALGHRIFERAALVKLNEKLEGNNENAKFKILKSPKMSQYKALELFAGAGGTALGLHNAGIHCAELVEIDTTACKTLSANMPQWSVTQKDITDYSYKGKEKIDIVAGGFPCQSFSYAGKGLGFGDIRGTMFFQFLRIVQETNPKILFAENVRGLEKHDGGRTLKTMLGALTDAGYKVEYKILRAQYLDVPQKRERLVIIGVRNDYSHVDIKFPEEQNYTVGLREALENVPPSPGQEYTAKKLEIMKKIPAGGYWRDLPDDLQRSYMGASYFHTGGRTGMARRLSWDEPSLTLTCNPAQKQTERCHPGETRPLRVREYARIQSFPDEWQFSGSTAAQYKQIGNAVPVNMAYHIGICLRDMLDKMK